MIALQERAGGQHDGRRAIDGVAADAHADDARCADREPLRRLSISRSSTTSCRSVRFGCSSTSRFISN